MKNLMKALLEAKRSIGTLSQSGKNSHLGNQYATIDDVLAAIRTPLADNGLVLIEAPCPEVENAVQTEATLYHVESGESLTHRSPLMPVAKANPQAVGSAMTYARRYLLTALFSLSAVDDDGNAASKEEPHAPARRSNGRKPQPTVPPLEETDTLPFEWADKPEQVLNDKDYVFSGPGEAMAWGNAMGVFNHMNHVQNTYNEVKEATKPKKAEEMWAAWIEEVAARVNESKSQKKAA